MRSPSPSEANLTRLFMRFLYRPRLLHLENLCARCHVSPHERANVLALNGALDAAMTK